MIEGQLPCIDCITLPICKARVISGDGKDPVQNIYLICSLVNDYVAEKAPSTLDNGMEYLEVLFNIERVDEVMAFMLGENDE